MEKYFDKYKFLEENIFDLIYVYNLSPKQGFEYVSSSSKNINGYSPEEHYKNPKLFYKLVIYDDLPLFEFILENPKMITKPVIIRWECKDGSMIWTEQRFINKYDDNAKHIAIECFIKDVTDIKETEFALRESEKKFRELFHQITDSIVLFKLIDNNQLKIIEVNNAVCNLLSYSREEFFNDISPFNLIEKPVRSKLPRLRDLLLERNQIFFETIVLTKYNQKIPVDINAHIFRLNGEIVILVIARDIRVRKKLEKEIIKTQRLESISILAGGIAHEFNNILSAILGNISIAKLQAKNDKELYEMLFDSEEAAIKAKKLINQLNTFSSGGAPIKERTSIKNIINKSISLLLKESNVDHKITISENLWYVDIDKVQISQVFNNVIINAVESLRDNGFIEIIVKNVTSKKNEVVALENKNYIKIIIKDNGIGIPKENIQKIFDPFFSTKEKGNGLGLAAVYSIIKRHEGFISVESKVNKGTTFYIYLLAYDDNIGGNEMTMKNKVGKNKGRILIMDDDDDVRFTTGKLIQKLQYFPDFARNGVEAIEIYKKSMEEDNKFDLVIIDLTIIGGMGGKDTIEALLKIDPDIKAIVSSGYYNDPVVSNYKDYGFKGYITKPFTINELEAAINKVIRKT